MDFDDDADTNSNRESLRSWDELESIEGDVSWPIHTINTKSQEAQHKISDVESIRAYNSEGLADNDIYKQKIR